MCFLQLEAIQQQSNRKCVRQWFVYLCPRKLYRSPQATTTRAVQLRTMMSVMSEGKRHNNAAFRGKFYKDNQTVFWFTTELIEAIMKSNE